MAGVLGRRLTAVGVGACVAFAAAEVTLRWTLPPVDLHDLSGIAAQDSPMADWADVDAFCAYRAKLGDYASGKTVNSQGFISTPELGAKDEGSLRIAFLGGSSTGGTSPVLEDEEPWPHLVAAELGEELGGRKVEHINGALPGFTTFESYGRLWSRIRFFEPDIVVVYHGWNEMYYFRREHIERWRVPEDGNWTFAGEGSVLKIRIEPHPIDPWIEWSSLLSRVRRSWFAEHVGEVSGGGRLASDWRPEALEVFRTNLKLILSAESVLGCKVYVVKQPTLIVPGLSEELRNRCGYELHGFDHDAHLRAYAAIYEVIDREVPADRVIDLTQFSGDPRLLLDHVHLRPEGARAVASSVAQHLLPSLQNE